MKKFFIIAALLLFAGVSYGQTLTKGSVLGMHVFNSKLKPDVSMNDYLEFMNKTVVPELNKLDGLTIITLKGDRGKHIHKYSWIYHCESVEVRNKYWPEEGGYGEEITAIFEKLMQETAKYVETTNDEYTDWIVL